MDILSLSSYQSLTITFTDYIQEKKTVYYNFHLESEDRSLSLSFTDRYSRMKLFADSIKTIEKSSKGAKF